MSKNKTVELYGKEWAAGTPMLEVELWHWAHDERGEYEGGRMRAYDHLKRAMSLVWNGGAEDGGEDGRRRGLRGIDWHFFSEQILWDLCYNPKVAFAGAASTGKSDICAAYGLMFYAAAPSKSLVMMTSTTLDAAQRRIWKSVSELWSDLRHHIPGVLVASENKIKGPSDKDDGEFVKSAGVALVAAGKGNEQKASESLVGAKHVRVLLIFDELPMLSRVMVMEALDNLQSNATPQVVAMGNPTSLTDAFSWFCEPKGQWKDLDKDVDLCWDGKRAFVRRVRCWDSPNWVARKNIYGYLQKIELIEEKLELWGRDNAKFYRMYEAWWSMDAGGSTIYSFRDFKLSGALDKYEPTDRSVLLDSVMGIDPSYKTESDDAPGVVLNVWRESTLKGPKVIIEYAGDHWFQESATKNQKRSYQLTNYFKQIAMEKKVDPKNVGFDITGATSFADVAYTIWSANLEGVSFAGKPPNDFISPYDLRVASEVVSNRMSFLWLLGEGLISKEMLRGMPVELVEEICSRKWIEGNGILTAESKKSYKKEHGKSPDWSDAFFIALFKAIQVKSVRGHMMGSNSSVESFISKSKQLDVGMGSHLSIDL